MLDDFAKVIRSSHSDALITAKGFADPAGSTAFNRRLGQRRAEAIRDYLTSNGGLAAGQMRAVSYGEDKKRQVQQGATGAGGRVERKCVDAVGATHCAVASVSMFTGRCAGSLRGH